MVDALLIQTLIMIVASVCAVGLVARMRLPAAVGYLVASGHMDCAFSLRGTKFDFWPSSASSFSCSWLGLSFPFQL